MIELPSQPDSNLNVFTIDQNKVAKTIDLFEKPHHQISFTRLIFEKYLPKNVKVKCIG